MQLFVLALVLGMVGHDLAAVPAGTRWSGPVAETAWMIVPKLVLAAAYGLCCALTRRQLGRPRCLAYLRLTDRATGLYRLAIIGIYGFDLARGALSNLRWSLAAVTGGQGAAATYADRVVAGNLIAIDEMLFLLPPLLLVVYGWWAYYPIDRRFREATLIRRLDTGDPIGPIWTRRQYLLSQLRHQIALMLVPLLILIAWSELVNKLFPQHHNTLALVPVVVQMAGAACIFLFAPMIIRHLWDTVPLPDGDLRRRLTEMCRLHRVGVRELLLWRTFGGMVNAAVMGLIRPLRFILLTDALLEQVDVRQVEAVMAHELAHVRRHHMFWLLMAALVLLLLVPAGWHEVLHRADPILVTAGLLDSGTLAAMSAWIVMGLTCVCWIPAFGWVSRRLERQADAFAVEHMARQQAATPGPPLRVDDSAAGLMTGALQRIADLNHMSARRPSWRHGSIAWRQSYLRTLVGQRVGQLAIDRQVLWIKVLTLCGAALVLMFWRTFVLQTL